MEGIGSRTGRPSSRYGSAPVFSGPVRRWQKQWVNVSSSSSSITYNHNNSSNSNGSNTSNVSAIRIRRWTPVPSGRDSDSVAEERPKRKIRYAPIVVLDGKRKEAEKGDVDVKEASKPKKSPDQDTLENDDNEKKSFDNYLAEKPQASQKNVEASKDLNQPMDSDAGGDDDEDHDLGGDNKVADWVKAAQRGFAS